MATTDKSVKTAGKSKKYIVGIGEALLDIFPDSPQRLGGAPLIFAYHSGKTFGKSVIVSAVGEDKEGKLIKEKIKSRCVEDKYLFTVSKPSGTVRVNDTDPNDPKYDIKTEVAWTEIPYEGLDELAKKTAAVYYGPLASHCGEISKQTIDRFLEAVPNNCWKIFDVNLRHNPKENNKYTDPLFSESLIKYYLGDKNKCNILKVNKEELEYLCTICGIVGNLSNKKKSEALLELYPHIKILLLTLGEEGSAVFWRKKEKKGKTMILYHYYGVSVEQPLNSVGAGDALAGAFIGKIIKIKENKKDLSQIDVENAHIDAVKRSAQVCKAGNSMPPIMNPDIFVSYSREDENIVRSFCSLFIAQNWSVWRDKEKIDYGDNFPKKKEEAIQNCKVVVFFSSEDSKKSKFVADEIEIANREQKRIIPFILKKSDYNSNFESIVKWKDSLDWDKLCEIIKNTK